MTDSAPTLPHPMLLNGLNHIPPPSVAEFDAVFGGYLPPGTSIPSSWGVIRYYDFAPKSPPSTRRVILVHGGGTCAIGMAPLAFKLTEAGNHVVIYDLWGHGNSSTPLETHSTGLMHAQIFELLAHLGWRKANFLGFSLGGGISVTFAAKHPQIVESLVIVTGTGLLKRSMRGWWSGLLMDGGWGIEWMSRRHVMDLINGPNLVITPGWKERMMKGDVDTNPIQMWERHSHKGHVASLTSMMRYGGVYDYQEDYGKLANGDPPVLVILAELDGVIFPDYTTSELMKLGWKGKIETVPGATHEIVRTHPQEVVDRVVKWWGSLEK